MCIRDSNQLCVRLPAGKDFDDPMVVRRLEEVFARDTAAANPTPEPTPTPEASPSPSAEAEAEAACEDTSGTATCEAKRDEGKCDKAWWIERCAKTCGLCGRRRAADAGAAAGAGAAPTLVENVEVALAEDWRPSDAD